MAENVDSKTIDKKVFMEEVQKYPVLYDKFKEEFRNNELKRNAWTDIGNAFNITSLEAEKILLNKIELWKSIEEINSIRLW